MKTTRKILSLLLALTMILTLTACGEDDDNGTTEQPTEQPANEAITEDDPAATTTELTVWGMVCVRCENKIIDALSGLDGVISVSADSSADKVEVIHDPELDIDTINRIITGEGFNIP